METLELRLTEFSRRSGSVLVSHSSLGLCRGLEPGERVLLDDAGTWHTAVVADIDFDLTDTLYRLAIGPGTVRADLPVDTLVSRLTALNDAVVRSEPRAPRPLRRRQKV